MPWPHDDALAGLALPALLRHLEKVAQPGANSIPRRRTGRILLIAPGLPQGVVAGDLATGVTLDGDDAPEADFHLYRLTAGSYSETKRMVSVE
jgi:hypothetical protein